MLQKEEQIELTNEEAVKFYALLLQHATQDTELVREMSMRPDAEVLTPLIQKWMENVRAYLLVAEGISQLIESDKDGGI